VKTIDTIPTSKIQRASKILQTGAKVGRNYLKYYGDKLTKPEAEAKENLNRNNAENIYDGLKKLKGSALKVAQMLSMEKNILPQAYVEKFSLSQFSVPPLSAPLVTKTFKKYFGKMPSQLFDSFNPVSINAASIGQVHKAEIDGKQLAVKIQYPGVAESIASDLAMVKPIAMRMLNIKGDDSDKYFKEVENKLFEETDYTLELEQSVEIADACKNIPNLKFPGYYKELSSDRIITMDWMEGEHLSEFTSHNTDQDKSNMVGQTLWDYYMFQIHSLRKVQADPHPGNFLIAKDGTLIPLDFGCMKEVPDEFYDPYFELANAANRKDNPLFLEKLYELEILRADDTEYEIQFFSQLFKEIIGLLSRPLNQEVFDFSDDSFFKEVAQLGEKFKDSSELRKMNGNRGSKHFIYINRTLFGLYNLMFDLKAKDIKINNYKHL
jgi:predicted unusual protein kinase regulating ubiquinone biosynthesis (AarF/ABC1/UbiB family)